MAEPAVTSRTPLHGEHILLCVCGGIAAYKAAELVRRLRDAGAQVRVAMTGNALRFVGAATFQALSGAPVRTSLWDEAAEAAMGHIELARWADAVLVAPAMNQQMWAHPATRANLATLLARGATVLGPAAGDQACGEVGEGRLLEPDEIVAALCEPSGA